MGRSSFEILFFTRKDTGKKNGEEPNHGSNFCKWIKTRTGKP